MEIKKKDMKLERQLPRRGTSQPQEAGRKEDLKTASTKSAKPKVSLTSVLTFLPFPLPFCRHPRIDTGKSVALRFTSLAWFLDDLGCYIFCNICEIGIKINTFLLYGWSFNLNSQSPVNTYFVIIFVSNIVLIFLELFQHKITCL